MNHLLDHGESWKTSTLFCFNKIETGIEIFSDKMCHVTFGFEYISDISQ